MKSTIPMVEEISDSNEPVEAEEFNDCEDNPAENEKDLDPLVELKQKCI
jgi:hypothetical protein